MDKMTLFNYAVEFGLWWNRLQDNIQESKTIIQNYAWACWTKVREIIKKKGMPMVDQVDFDGDDEVDEDEATRVAECRRWAEALLSLKNNNTNDEDILEDYEVVEEDDITEN